MNINNTSTYIKLPFHPQSFILSIGRIELFSINTRMSFGARNSLWQNGNGDQVKIMKSYRAIRQRQRLRLGPAPVIYPDEITALYSYTID